MMCIGSCFSCLSLLPYVWLITLPLYGCFAGVDAAIRVSLVMSLFAVISSVVPKYADPVLPLVNLGILSLVVSLPLGVVPGVLTWAYRHALWVCEPLLMVAEAVYMVTISVDRSSVARDMMDEFPAAAKTYISSIAVMFYLVAGYFAYLIAANDDPFVRWILLLLVLVAGAVFFCMYAFDDGCVSDSAVVTACSFAFCYAFTRDQDYSREPLAVPSHWGEVANSTDVSFANLLLDMAHLKMEQSRASLQFLGRLLSLHAVLLAALRLFCVISVVAAGLQMYKEYAGVDEDGDESGGGDVFFASEGEDEGSVVGGVLRRLLASPLALRLSAIFVYTQLVAGHIDLMTSSLAPRLFSFARLIQAVGVNCVYVYTLASSDNCFYTSYS